MSARLVPGHNVDRVDVDAGLRELAQCGYDDPHTRMVIEYALARWARGEEEQAERGAIDKSFHGIELTCWRRVLAAAVATAEAAAPTREMLAARAGMGADEAIVIPRFLRLGAD